MASLHLSCPLDNTDSRHSWPYSGCRRQRADPPHILLTTPESLSLLLSYPESADLFAGLKRIVIDEVHAFATDKRGDLLALSLARLNALAPKAQRVALSATLANTRDFQEWLAPQTGEAGEIAAALKAEKLILMTDVPGVLRDKDDVSTKFAALSIRDCRQLVEDGVIAGGMIPKVQCCVRCIAQGVTAAHIIDGRSPHSVLMELLTDEGVGTMITG